VKRRENLTDAEHDDLRTMLKYLPQLDTLRKFMDKIYALFDADQTMQQAGCRRSALIRNNAFALIPELAKVQQMITSEKFAKMMAFLRSPVGNQVRTNNHVERTNRKLRYYEKVRYKWRRRRNIIRFVLLAIDRWWRQHPQHSDHHSREPTKTPQNKAPRKPNTSCALSG